jgi:hypothetical protein
MRASSLEESMFVFCQHPIFPEMVRIQIFVVSTGNMNHAEALCAVTEMKRAIL